MSGTEPASHPVLVAGAGPAGLTAALTLARAGRPVVVAERADDVGGLARTIERNGFRFDLGGHRFHTTVPEIQALWREILGPDMLLRPRRSRILFEGRYFDYPLTASSVFAGLGLAESARILLSYLRARISPIRPEVSIADWVTNRFGRRLFETFFRTYTEKVWGTPCEAIGAQWAAQRIRGLSLWAAVADMFRRGRGGHRTLATEFQYPRLGPGMLWSRMLEEIRRRGGRVLLQHALVAVDVDGGRVREVRLEGPGGPESVPVSHLISTIPLRDLCTAVSPPLPPETREAALALRHRDFIEVAVILSGADPFPDTWLYLHDRQIAAGRIQNFRAWSPALVPGDDHACLGLEYFCNAGDALWRLPDRELLAIATADLKKLGFCEPGRIVQGHAIRVRGAYPVYDEGYRERLATLRAALDPIANLGLAGRNGMHRYDNMDHSMLTGLLAARNALGERHDPWSITTEDERLDAPHAAARVE